MAIGDFEQMQQLSARASAAAPPGTWIASYAWSLQALYWTYVDTDRAWHCIQQGRQSAKAARAPLLDTMTAMWSANLLTGDPEHDRELGGDRILESVLSETDDALLSEAYQFLAIVAAVGDPTTARRLISPRGATTPVQRFGFHFATAVIAIRQGRTDAARDALGAMASEVREHAIPLGEVACLTGFATLAAELGDYEHASRWLASVRGSATGFPFRTPVDGLLYRQTARLVRGALDAETAARCRSEGSRIPVSEALDAALAPEMPTASPAGPQPASVTP
jgi:hypothetical protein